MKIPSFLRALSATAPALFLAISALPAAALQGAVTLGTAESFGVLASSTVTNTGPTLVEGDLGVSPGSALTGFPPGLVVPPGEIHLADAVALQAQADANTAYNDLAGRACDTDLTGMDLGGLTLTPGVYCFSSSAQLTGNLTLDAQGNPAAIFIFQIGSTLTTASGASVSMINGGDPCNVFWQVGSSATLGTGTTFIGDILALASITMTTGTNTSGRLIALNGAVTLDSNQITACLCLTTSITDLGPGCVGSFPMLTITPVVIGQMVTFNITGAAPNSMIKVHLSLCGGTPFMVGGGCTAYIDLSSEAVIFMGVTDANGDFSVSFNMPTNPALEGLCFVVQASVWDMNMLVDLLSNGLEVRIGCQ